MGMTLKELLTKGEGTLTAGEAKTLASQCRMDVETLYTLLEERGIKILDDEADGDTSLDVEGIMAEVESAEANSDELGLGDENEDDPAEENPADLKAAMDELLDDPVKNYLKQIGQIPLLSAEQEVDLSKRIHAGAEAAHILQADRQKYGAPEYIKKNSARFSFEEDENSRSYTEDLDEDGNTKSSEDDEEKAAEEEAMEAVENGPLTEERRQELLKIRRDGLNARRSLSEATAAAGVNRIESAQDIQTWFTGYGLDVDGASITADKVKIPRKWDDSFSAFNGVVQQSGMDLIRYKGKTVEKMDRPDPGGQQRRDQPLRCAAGLPQKKRLWGPTCWKSRQAR